MDSCTGWIGCGWKGSHHWTPHLKGSREPGQQAPSNACRYMSALFLTCMLTQTSCLQKDELDAFCEKTADEQLRICKQHLDAIGENKKRRKADAQLEYPWAAADIYDMVSNYFRNHQHVLVIGKYTVCSSLFFLQVRHASIHDGQLQVSWRRRLSPVVQLRPAKPLTANRPMSLGLLQATEALVILR